ncbi:MAG: tetratricopeptide repeat protein [candidate division Zixibacteria bacterium]|nr:tetratricopeptide repeat protein [candidate division Zixibacteria bacterium]
MRTLLTYLTCIILAFGCSFASDDAGTQSPFSMGTGARELSLGGSNLAISDNTTAPYWNPSRLTRADRISLGGFYSRLYDSDVAYQYMGFVFPTLDYGSFGLGIFRLGINGIEKRDVHNFLKGYIQDERLGFYLAYGKAISQYDFGFALNMEHHSLDTYSTTSSPGLNLSVARQISTHLNWLEYYSLALVGRNLISLSSKLADESVSYPIGGNFGLAVRLLPKPSWNQALTMTAKFTKVEDIESTLAFGLEYSLYDILSLRSGLRGNKFSAGCGINYKLLNFDYAYVGRDMGGLHMFSITMTFGASMGERRQRRAQDRETEFNDLMNKQLSTHNLEIINDMVHKGQESAGLDSLEKAISFFERALFLARINSIDTSNIYQLGAKAKSRLTEINNKKHYREYHDSAQAKLESKNYIDARYYANLALSIDSVSKETLDLIKRIDDSIQQIASKEEMIRKHLSLIDSLLSYGELNQAYSAVQKIKQFAAEDNRVSTIYKRVIFERYRETAASAYSENDFDKALVNIDSALTLYPQHQLCLNLHNNILEKMSRNSAPVVHRADGISKPLSDVLLKEVEESYSAARKLFVKGDLHQAIIQWEKVEQLAPDYEAVREYLANAYKYAGVELYGCNKLKQAIEMWEKVRKLDPANAEIKKYIDRTNNELERLNELSNNSN